MKRRLSALAAALLVFTPLVSCSDSSTGTQSEPSNSSAELGENMVTESLITRGTEFQDKFGDVPSAESGPLISINNVTASPGETAEVTVSISNAELNWNMCGIHLYFPDALECVLSDPEELLVKQKKGDALEAAVGLVSMQWVNQLPEELTSRHYGSIFFTTMFSGDQGLDGDIATFYFVVPEEAKPGAVYNIGFFYTDTDMFTNLEGDPSFEKYAFEHVQGGTITVV